MEWSVSMKATTSCSNPDETVLQMVKDGWKNEDIVKYFQLLDYLPGEIRIAIKRARLAAA